MKTASKKELQSVILLAKFDMTRPDNRVEYDLWYTSTNEIMLDFIQDFSEIDDQFGENVLMTPRFVFWECKNCDEEFLTDNCFAKGAYCATELSNSMTGKEIIIEDLR